MAEIRTLKDGDVQVLPRTVSKAVSMENGNSAEVEINKKADRDLSNLSDYQKALANLGGRPNRNLFDNAFFAGLSSRQFPVRQKGDTMDRWGNAYVTLNFLASGVKLASMGSDSYIEQKFENPADFAGKTLTISAWVKDISIGAYIKIYAFNGSEFTVSASDELITEDICFAAMEIPSDTTNLFARLYVKQSGSATYVAAKCEEGDKQTLGWKDDEGIHLFDVPNYQETLTRCRRQLYKVPINRNLIGSTSAAADSIILAIDLPVEMRTTPVISGFQNCYIRHVGGQYGAFTPIVRDIALTGNQVIFQFDNPDKANIKGGTPIIAFCTSGWFISAEL